MLDHLLTNNLILCYQHGFVPARSTVTQLLAVLDKRTDIIDCGGNFDAVYFDFAKAFDSVPYLRLIRKLKALSITDKVLQWISALLSDRRQRVVLDGTASSWLPATSGVPQGSVLGTVLFVVFINDLPDVVKSWIYMYTDDTKITRQIATVCDCAILQMDLDQLYLWADTQQLKFNTNKCEVIHFGHSNVKSRYSMEGNFLADVLTEKDLGVLVDDKLSFSNHISGAVLKAN